VGPGQKLSKAQKVLGATGVDLNIDSPNRDDSRSWRSFSTRPASSGMSVAISESTQDDDLSITSNGGTFDIESGAQLQGKASSTLLGRRYQDEAATDASSVRWKLHTERSSSTLRSYYDRQNTPLSVSQQTSASSVRDLALRKGHPPVTQDPRSPLLEMDCFETEAPSYDIFRSEKSQSSQSSKKKPARLDLTKLFPKPKGGGGPILGEEHLTRSPSAISLVSTDSRRSDGSRKLTKSDPRNQKAAHSTQNHDRLQPTSAHKIKPNRLSDLYEDRESMPSSSSRPQLATVRAQFEKSPQIRPFSSDRGSELSRMRDLESQQSPITEDQWTRAGLASPSWDTRSFISTSSRNTTGSRHTNASVISSADLRNNSVLSMSSSDEDSDEEMNISISASRIQRVKKPGNPAAAKVSGSSTSIGARSPKGHSTKPIKIPRTQDRNFLTIPLPPLAGSRISGPWNPPSNRQSQGSAPSRQGGTPPTPESPVTPGIQSRPGLQDFPVITGRNSRLMAVTKQEEALLEALRQKRARMKESIIAEHEIGKSPPRALNTRHVTRDSTSSVATVRPEKRGETQRVLLYLDAPVSYGRDIDTAEPSPDLSDFLSFGSDEDDDSTPRTSWMVGKDRGRADSVTSPEPDARDSPKTPQSAARLSAVGALDGLVGESRGDGRKGVTFLEGVKNGSPDFLEELDIVWGL
jgi:hypothetical protein